MSLLKLTIATTDYDHFRDSRLGTAKAEGIDLNWLDLGHHECFARFTANREFDLSELSFAHRQFKPEEIFPEGIMTRVVI